jgi:hypothetical protein
VPSAAFPREDRLSLALLLAPVLVVTLALGAMQLLVPADSARTAACATGVAGRSSGLSAVSRARLY